MPCDIIPGFAVVLRCLAKTKSHSAPHCHDNAIQCRYLTARHGNVHSPRCIVPCRRHALRFLTASQPDAAALRHCLTKLCPNFTTSYPAKTRHDRAALHLHATSPCETLLHAAPTVPHATIPSLRETLPKPHFTLPKRNHAGLCPYATSHRPNRTLLCPHCALPYSTFAALYATWPPRRVGGHGCDGLKTTQCRMQATCGEE